MSVSLCFSLTLFLSLNYQKNIQTQEHVTGSVDLSLYKGNVTIIGRSSEFSLYDSKIVTFEDDENAYNQADATGFIKINSLRLKQFARRKRKTNR